MTKGDIPLRKTFNGKRYEFYGSYGSSKLNANNVANSFREGGDLARVTKIDNEYCLYVRRV